MMGRRRTLTPEQVAEAERLLAAGYSARETGHRLGVSKDTVCRRARRPALDDRPGVPAGRAQSAGDPLEAERDRIVTQLVEDMSPASRAALARALVAVETALERRRAAEAARSSDVDAQGAAERVCRKLDAHVARHVEGLSAADREAWERLPPATRLGLLLAAGRTELPTAADDDEEDHRAAS